MFVKNRENIDFQYRKNGYLAVLKANTVSYVDETKVSAKDLIDCYGQRVAVMSSTIDTVTPVEETEVKPVKKAETVKKEDLNDSFIEKILEEVKEEVKEEAPKEEKTEVKEEVKEEAPKVKATPKVKSATKAKGRAKSKKN